MYHLSIEGDGARRCALSGAIVVNGGNLSQGFTSRTGRTVFHYRYRSDARFVLKRLGKQFGGTRTTPDRYIFDGAVVQVSKAAS